MKDLLQRLIAEGKVEVLSLGDVFDEAPTHDEITSKSLEEFLHALGKSNFAFTNVGLDKEEIDRATKAFDTIKRNEQGKELLEAYLGEDFMHTINNVVDNIHKSKMGMPNEYLQSQRKEEPKSKLDEHMLTALKDMMTEIDCMIKGVPTVAVPYKTFFNLLLTMHNKYGKNIHSVIHDLNNHMNQEMKEMKASEKDIWNEAIIKTIQTKILTGLDSYFQVVYRNTKDVLSDVYTDEDAYMKDLTNIVKAKLKNKLWDFNYNGEFSKFLETLRDVIDNKFTNAAISYNHVRVELLETIRHYNREELIKYYKTMEASK